MRRVYISSIPIVLLLSFVLGSCGTSDNVVSSWPIQKRKYNKGWYIPMFAKKPKLVEHKQDAAPFKTTQRRAQESTETAESKVREQIQRMYASLTEENSDLSLLFHPALRTDSPATKCDLITFRNGEEVKAIVIEVGINDILYKKCNMPDGPIYTRRKFEVKMITYSSGEKDIFTYEAPETIKPRVQNQYRVTETNSLISFIAGIFGIFIWPLGIPALILGIIGLNKIAKEPERYKGSGWAITGIIFGTLETIITIFIVIVIIAILQSQ